MKVEQYILKKFEIERQLNNKDLSEKERDELLSNLCKIQTKITKVNTRIDSFDIFLVLLMVFTVFSCWVIFF